MTDNELADKFLKIFNRNIPLNETFNIEEIKEAFLKENHTSGNEREKELYIRFFTECAENNKLKEFIKFSGTTATKLKRLYSTYKDDKKIEFGIFWEKRFRINKDNSVFEIPSRQKGIYKDIEKFELYELTPCIAYEMAIRNNEVKILLAQIEIVNNMTNEDSYLYKRLYREETFYDLKEKKNLEGDYQNLTYEEYINKRFEKSSSYSKYFKKFPEKFVHNYIRMCTELNIIHLKDLYKELENKLINEYLIYPTGHKRKIPKSALNNEEIMESLSREELNEIMDVKRNNEQTTIVTNEFKIIPNPEYKAKRLNRCLEEKTSYRKLHNDNLEEVTNSQKKEQPTKSNKDHNEDIIFEEAIHQEFIQVQALFPDKHEYSLNNIIPNFKRQVNDQEQMIVPINFSLPIEEIVEYITKIKENINPKTPLELMGEKLNKAVDITTFYIRENKFKDLPALLADLIYIYDMKQRSYISHQEIMNELNANYGKKDAIRNDIVNYYYDLAVDYIENKKYRELITGKIEKT